MREAAQVNHGIIEVELLVRSKEKMLVTDEDIEHRQAKWRNFFQASAGRMFVICDNHFCMRNIRSEINYCLGNKPLVVSQTNLAGFQTGKRGEGESVWIDLHNRGLSGS